MQYISPAVKTVTQNGECKITISLELNINLNSDGKVSVSPSISESKVIEQKKKEEDVDWVIPDFGSSEKIKFGQHVKE